MKAICAVALLATILATEDSVAADWQPMFGTTTADLAAAGWSIQSSSGLSWPDGRQGVLTFWKHDTYLVRCITAFNADEQQTGDLCKHSGLGEVPSWVLAPMAREE